MVFKMHAKLIFEHVLNLCYITAIGISVSSLQISNGAEKIANVIFDSVPEIL